MPLFMLIITSGLLFCLSKESWWWCCSEYNCLPNSWPVKSLRKAPLHIGVKGSINLVPRVLSPLSRSREMTLGTRLRQYEPQEWEEQLEHVPQQVDPPEKTKKTPMIEKVPITLPKEE